MSLYIGKNIIHVEELDSTNKYAKKLLREHKNIPDGTIVWSDYQNSGKGYGTNKWESERGKNLTFSLIIYPHYIPPEEQFTISKAVSLGLCDYLKTMMDHVTIKWPNDVYVQDRKIAGILIENAIARNTITHSIIGIGLNVNQTIFRSDAPNPTSVKLRIAKEKNLHTMLPVVATFIENRLLQLETERGFSISDDYIANLYRLNQFHKFTKNGIEFKAKIIKVNDEGHLILMKEDKTYDTYRFKEVNFII